MGSLDTNLVLDALADPDNAIVAVQASTGSGKSTLIPAALANDGQRVFVGVPTNAAARSLAAYVGKQNPQLTVGFGSEGERNYNDNTLLVFMTHGHLLNVLLSGFSKGQPERFPDIDVLMVDEAHTGTLEVTLILRLWVLYTLAVDASEDKEEEMPPLLISSATLDGMNLSPIREFEVVSIEFTVQMHSIQVRYHSSTPGIDSPDLYQQMAEVAGNLYRQTQSGHGLIFVPGAGETESVARKLREGPLAVKNALILTAYGSMGSEALQEIINPTETRKIIITTNVMESALTVDNVSWILDSMAEKVLESSSTGGIRLVTVYESKSSAVQRCGRTGRTREGICYRMCTEAVYNSEKIPPLRVEEIDRVPIFKEVMALINVGLTPAKVLPQVSPERLLETQNLLESQGMISEPEDSLSSGLTITEMGRLASRLPLGVRTGRLVYEWVTRGLPVFPGLVLATIIDSYGPSYFYLPRRGKMDSIQYHQRLQEVEETLQEFGGPDPLEAFLGMARYALIEFQTLTPRPGRITGWAQDFSLNARKLREFFSILNRVDKIVNRFFQINSPVDDFTVEGVLRAARPILGEIYSGRLLTRQKGLNFVDTSGNSYRLRGTGAYPEFRAPEKVLCLDLLETKNRGRVFRSIVLWTTTEDPEEFVDTTSELLEEVEARFGL